MPVSTMFTLLAVVGAFALVAIALAWAQLHARNFTIGSTAPEPVHRPRRRPF
jgi:hypothetical protein